MEAETRMSTRQVIGQALRRLEDPRLVTGG